MGTNFWWGVNKNLLGRVYWERGVPGGGMSKFLAGGGDSPSRENPVQEPQSTETTQRFTQLSVPNKSVL